MIGRRPLCIVVSCEHATNRVPPRWRALFRGRARLLASHRGWDPGALELARCISASLGQPLDAAVATRLLADTNRSVGHPRLFSEITHDLSRAERERILDAIYHPHRQRVETRIEQVIAQGRLALHVGVHSFAPELDGVVRRTDVGLLYDPRRPGERALALEFRRRLAAAQSWRVCLNDPYRGNADGLTTTLRRRFPEDRYWGIELEVNQRLVKGSRARWLSAQHALALVLRELLVVALA